MTQEKATPWRLESSGDIVNAEGVIVLKVWNGYDNGVDAITAVNEHDELLSEVAQLKSALQKILDNDDECGCEHDNENCCELNHVFCPRCIAARALLGKVNG